MAECLSGMWCSPGVLGSTFCLRSIERFGICNTRPGDIESCATQDVCAPESAWEGDWVCREWCEPFISCSEGSCRAFGMRGAQKFYACY